MRKSGANLDKKQQSNWRISLSIQIIKIHIDLPETNTLLTIIFELNKTPNNDI